MTTSTLIDSNIFIDLFADSTFFEASRDALLECMLQGPLVMGAVVWAELGHAVPNELELKSRLRWLRLQQADFPFEAAFVAGQAHRLYRQRGGRRERTLPDFLIGAHATVAGHRLLTRDPARYRSYFPDLDIIAPEMHP